MIFKLGYPLNLTSHVPQGDDSMSKQLDPRLLAAINKVTGKRPRTVIEHILEHGHITTEELQDYGYNHPPRAARDVREAGIPLETFRVRSRDGRSIGAYRFGDPALIERHKLAGRSTLPKDLHDRLYAISGGRCYSCYHEFESRYLQVDHRIPYEIAGEPAEADDTAEFMLLCGPCQRRKSWSCENCPNWGKKDSNTCRACYWARPEQHDHVATVQLRRVELTFSGDEVGLYEKLCVDSEAIGLPIADLIKRRLTDE